MKISKGVILLDNSSLRKKRFFLYKNKNNHDFLQILIKYSPWSWNLRIFAMILFFVSSLYIFWIFWLVRKSILTYKNKIYWKMILSKINFFKEKFLQKFQINFKIYEILIIIYKNLRIWLIYKVLFILKKSNRNIFRTLKYWIKELKKSKKD